MKKRKVYSVTSGDIKTVRAWKQEAPDRIIPSVYWDFNSALNRDLAGLLANAKCVLSFLMDTSTRSLRKFNLMQSASLNSETDTQRYSGTTLKEMNYNSSSVLF